jgi:hypothetical protein
VGEGVVVVREIRTDAGRGGELPQNVFEKII